MFESAENIFEKELWMGRPKKIVLMLTLVSISIILASGMALAATIVGDNNANTITGTADPDTLLGYGGTTP